MMVDNLRELLADELILHNITHEIPPPGSDCYGECGVVEMHAGISAPMRSGGKKHKRCMECWNEYIIKLHTKILNLFKSRVEGLKVIGDEEYRRCLTDYRNREGFGEKEYIDIPRDVELGWQLQADKRILGGME